MTAHPPGRTLAGMTDSRRLRGSAAEWLAADHLERHGLVVLARNLGCRAGELDLVCLDGEVLVVVEVRCRRGAAFGGAAASVDWRKQRRIVRATRFQCRRRPEWRARCVRFDVIAVEDTPQGPPRLVWITDAFAAQ